MKKYEVAPRFNEEIVEKFSEEEIVIISGGRRAAEIKNYVCPQNGYCPQGD